MKNWLKSLLLSSSIFPCLAMTQFYFPKSQISLGYYNHASIPWKFPALPKPLFWNSRYSADRGFMFSYLTTRYHTKKYFLVNLGTSISDWQSKVTHLYAFSILFELRLFLFRSTYFNPYIFYSIAGPTYLSKSYFAGSKLGGNFIFQDYMGAGVLLGKEPRINIEAKTVHYSNGDLAVYNKGLQVPFVISFGMSF